MSQLKSDTINHMIKVEGGYVNDPNDSGGETNFGITKRVAHKNGYTQAMADMPKTTAFNIYATQYWDALSLDNIEQHSSIIAKELADTGVNMGTGRAAEFLQRSLNALNNQGALYADLNVDRDLGPTTLRALNTYLKKRGKRGEVVLHRALNCLQGAFYIDLVERRQKDERFFYGWLENRVS